MATRVSRFLSSILDTSRSERERKLLNALRECEAANRAYSNERMRDVNGWGKLTRYLLENARDEILPGENSSEMAIRLLIEYKESECYRANE